MKKNIVSLLLGVVVGLVIGFFLGVAAVQQPNDVIKELEIGESGNTSTEVGELSTDNMPIAPESESEVTATTQGHQIVIPVSSLPEAQQQVIRTLGIAEDEIVITGEMLACAEGEVGAARIEELKQGAAPTFLESVTLFNCYNK